VGKTILLYSTLGTASSRERPQEKTNHEIHEIHEKRKKHKKEMQEDQEPLVHSKRE
jgi:hypothetical protein